MGVKELSTMKVLGLMLCCVLVAQANVLKSEHQKEFENWVAEHGKTYNNVVEREFRYKIFVEALTKIIKHNREYDAGLQTFKMGLNKYSDMLHSELFNDAQPHREPKTLAALPKPSGKAVPETFDWRDKGAVTEVKDQGQCGACWAFSATGSLESHNFLTKGDLVSLSEKNLIDCSQLYGNNGCGGGAYDFAWDYMLRSGGIDTEESYPYVPEDGECQYNPANSALELDSYVMIKPREDEEALKEAVATIGPMSVSIFANIDFQYYKGGVMTSETCSTSFLNHAVLVVGYGNEDGQDYWLVKNSWGVSFGEEGYIKMRRNYNNMCGVATSPMYPVIKA